MSIDNKTLGIDLSLEMNVMVIALLQVNGARAEHATWYKCPQSEKEHIDKVRKERVVREILG
jgi:hypothetical protein